MIVCLCHNVNERTVRAAIREGATTRFDVKKRTCAGTGCGMCVPDIDRLLREERAALDAQPVAAK